MHTLQRAGTERAKQAANDERSNNIVIVTKARGLVVICDYVWHVQSGRRRAVTCIGAVRGWCVYMWMCTQAISPGC